MNKRGNMTGLHGNHRRGKTHGNSKMYDLYQHGEFKGTYLTLQAVGEVIGKSAAYVYQMTTGKTGKDYKSRNPNGHPSVTESGYVVLKHGTLYGSWYNQ